MSQVTRDFIQITSVKHLLHDVLHLKSELKTDFEVIGCEKNNVNLHIHVCIL